MPPENILYLFPDTNLFIQCRDLKELDWSPWQAFTEIHLIVAKPVQREIDEQKNLGNTRVGRRARKTNSLFREIAGGQKDFQLIVDSSVPVKLFLEAPSRPSTELSAILDYSKADDELIGCFHRFRSTHPGADARLLTHDTGPMMTAKNLSLPVEPIHDSWLLPPASNRNEKEIARLKNEIKNLRSAEPKFTIHCVDSQGNNIDKLDLKKIVYEPLDSSHIAAFLEELRDLYPLATEFNDMGVQPLLGPSWNYKPPTDHDVSNYVERAYPQWLKDCEESLHEAHESLSETIMSLTFSFKVENHGTRPGNKALIVIRATGNFKVSPLAFDDDAPSEPAQAELIIPSPPKPPSGHFVRSSNSMIPRMSTLSRQIESGLLGSRRHFNRELIDPTIFHGSPVTPQRYPNEFYFYPMRPEKPVASYELPVMN